MSTPFVWIIFPALVSVVLLILQRWERLVAVIGTLTCTILAALAWWLPTKEQFFIGPWVIRLANSLSIFGRHFVLTAEERPMLIVFYLGVAFWFGASVVAGAGRWFIPLGLGMTALLTAAVAVEPFLYAALLIELAVLISIPFLTPPSSQRPSGILRYLTFQTLGMPFILFTGWMLSGIEAEPADSSLVLHASVLIGLGLALLFGVFPFHTWIPMLMKDCQPYVSAFVLILLPGAISFLMLEFLQRFPWLRADEILMILRSVGILMVVIAGALTAFEQHLARMLGYAVLIEIGFILIVAGSANSKNTDDVLRSFYAAAFPRGLGFGLWALGLSIFHSRTPRLYMKDVEGLGRVFPLATCGVILGNLSLAGLPLLPGFPIRLAIWENLAELSPQAAYLTLLGCLGLMLAGLRTLAALVGGASETKWQMDESTSQRIFLLVGLCAFILAGLMVQWLLPLFANLPQAFQPLTP